MKDHTFTCRSCHRTLTYSSDFTTGYGSDKRGRKFCYDCIAKDDLEYMRQSGRVTLYLTMPQGAFRFDRFSDGELTNWPGSLRFRVRVKKGNHNIARTRYDVWFYLDGFEWYGVQYGEQTQLCHCKRTKHYDHTQQFARPDMPTTDYK